MNDIRWNYKSIPTSISAADQEKPKNFSSQKPHTEHPSRLRSHARKISGQVNFCHCRIELSLHCAFISGLPECPGRGCNNFTKIMPSILKNQVDPGTKIHTLIEI
ncbi:hypothetical protein ES288_A05G437300v1 [Gossypium darwinii]|uniref:Uncharacterized protein n=1 Tax=Gossypium darwinii TaxID=34276 RepID=A0A5D2GS26_GOSDA|nr:hypothetical protein ES288_A05G437300v1 [Gossypium darwinii]